MFRERYLDHDELLAQLRAWADRHPDVVRLSSLGTTPGGREIPILTLGRDPDRIRPAAWVDGNLHASELCGSSVALTIAEDVLGLLLGKDEAGGKPLPAHLADALRDTLFYVVPRISPDGAEEVLKRGRYVRSSPVNDRTHRDHASWEAGDVDGDGQVTYQRQRHPDGELVELRDEGGRPLDPPVLVPRLPEDEGPFFRLFPEGFVANFDGRRVPDGSYLGDTNTDFNRNFPHDWAPEPQQAGAGHYPGSRPETRAVIEFATRHPNIFAWLNLHTFGGVVIRPLGDAPDSAMDPTDLAIFAQVGAWMTEHTGYPTVSGYHEFLYEPERPLRGDLSEWAYHQRGALAYVVELWDLFRQLGIERKKPFVDHYSTLDRAQLRALARFDREVNEGRIFRRWRPVKHPQLGDVEVGGFDPRIGIWNPPLSKLAETCASQSAAFLRVASLGPRLALEVVGQERLAPDLTRVEVRVANRGYLGTCGLPSAKALPIVEPLRLTVEGAKIVAPAEAVVELGHLEGWGRGLNHGPNLFLPWTRGNGNERFVTVVVEGAGPLRIRVGSSRVGYLSVEVPLAG